MVRVMVRLASGLRLVRILTLVNGYVLSSTSSSRMVSCTVTQQRPIVLIDKVDVLP